LLVVPVIFAIPVIAPVSAGAELDANSCVGGVISTDVA